MVKRKTNISSHSLINRRNHFYFFLLFFFYFCFVCLVTIVYCARVFLSFDDLSDNNWSRVRLLLLKIYSKQIRLSRCCCFFFLSFPKSIVACCPTTRCVCYRRPFCLTSAINSIIFHRLFIIQILQLIFVTKAFHSKAAPFILLCLRNFGDFCLSWFLLFTN